MQAIEHIARTYLSDHQPFVLATVLSRQGSLPRTIGAKMVVAKDGSTYGTIGGGQMESIVIQAAMNLFLCGPAQLIPIDLTSEDCAAMDMICGGKTEVFLDLIQPTRENIEVFDRWCNAQERGHRCYFTTVVRGAMEEIDDVAHCLLYPDATVEGKLPGFVLPVEHLLDKIKPSAGITVVRQDQLTVILETATGSKAVYIFGAGHVAQPTAHLASLVAFRVSVLDDRAAFANRQRFQYADDIRVIEDFGRAFADLSIEENDFIVILTRGHIHDKTVLAQALRTNAGYIGMIGSRRKRDIIYRALVDEGFTREDLDRVHSPIGLSIGADTPEEIAVSIVAEMIQARARMS